MPKIKFRTQGTSPASGRINEPGGGMKQYPSDNPSGPVTAGTVTIQTNRPNGADGRPTAISPGGFYVEAIATGFSIPGQYALAYPEQAAYLDLHYKWNFDQAGQLYTRFDNEDMPWDRMFDVDGTITKWNKPGTPSGTSVQYLGIDKNLAYGPHCGHIMRVPDFEGQASKVLTISVEVTSRDMVLAGMSPVTATLEVTLLNPDVFFPEADTVYIDPDGDFTGVPAGSPKVTSFYDAIALHARDSRTPRIRFRRGKEHDTYHPDLGDTSRTDSWRGTSYYEHGMMDAWGPEGDGDPVLLTGTSGGISLRAKRDNDSSTTFADLHIKGNYDPAAPWTNTFHSSGDGYPGLSVNYTNYPSAWNIISEGHRVAVKSYNDFIAGNCYFGSWYDYGTFGDASISNLGYAGCSFKQKIGAVIRNKSPNRYSSYMPAHGPWRSSGSNGKMSVVCGDHRSCNSWTGYFQPCIRSGGNGYVDAENRSRGNFDRIRMEMNGGIGTGAFKGPYFPKLHRYDKIYELYAQGAWGSSLLLFGCSGVRVTNVFQVIGKHVGNVSPGGHVDVMGNRKGENIENDPDAVRDPSLYNHNVNVSNVTTIDLRDAAQMGNGSFDALNFELAPHEDRFPWNEVSHDNFMLHSPNRSSADGEYYDAGPLVGTNSGWLPTWAGLYIDEGDAQATSAADVTYDPNWQFDHDAPIWAAAPGSQHYQAATGWIPVDDFYGTLRPELASEGAIEPASLT